MTSRSLILVHNPRSHVFSNISRILSRCDEEAAADIEAQEMNSAQVNIIKFIIIGLMKIDIQFPINE